MDKKEKAKQVKIETLYKGQLKQFGKKLRGRCPFHIDSGQPNFFIFQETNSWYCFRCGFGGDVIDFVMRDSHLTFKQALKKLI